MEKSFNMEPIGATHLLKPSTGLSSIGTCCNRKVRALRCASSAAVMDWTPGTAAGWNAVCYRRPRVAKRWSITRDSLSWKRPRTSGRLFSTWRRLRPAEFRRKSWKMNRSWRSCRSCLARFAVRGRPTNNWTNWSASCEGCDRAGRNQGSRVLVKAGSGERCERWAAPNAPQSPHNRQP